VAILRKTAILRIDAGETDSPEIENRDAKQFADEANHAQSQLLNSQLTLRLAYFKTCTTVILRKIAIVGFGTGEVTVTAEKAEIQRSVDEANHAQS
jgi:hypothetical protein